MVWWCGGGGGGVVVGFLPIIIPHQPSRFVLFCVVGWVVVILIIAFACGSASLIEIKMSKGTILMDYLYVCCHN